ncbi:hypothetical protein K9M79_08785 [Candidatus Woesearchaeota archaeon]|nr:hypothetical protein [Candidatus Woesearchaeota archaeon]
MRDAKHRLNNTIILILTLIISIETFFIISGTLPYEVSGLISFAIAVLIYTIYAQWSVKQTTHEITQVNTHTQVWLGQIILVACIVVLIGNTIMGVEFSTMLLWMSGTVVAILLLTIRKFDKYLEHKMKLEDTKKAAEKAAAPSKKKSKRKAPKKRGKKK